VHYASTELTVMSVGVWTVGIIVVTWSDIALDDYENQQTIAPVFSTITSPVSSIRGMSGGPINRLTLCSLAVSIHVAHRSGFATKYPSRSRPPEILVIKICVPLASAECSLFHHDKEDGHQNEDVDG